MTNPRIIAVTAQENFTLLLEFDNHERRIFDMKPFMDKGIFRALQDKTTFASVKPLLGSIQWSNGADLCPDTLYLDSVVLEDISQTLPSSATALHQEPV
jgi:Protein of unknown function (DUF2442)